MTSLNFDDDGQLGSMELYNLRLQKVIADFTEFDAVSKAYVDKKMDDLVDGASTTLDTLKEIETYLTDQSIAGTLAKEIAEIKASATAETTRATGAEGSLSNRITALESDPTTGSTVSALQAEVNKIETGAGLTFDGDYTANASSNYLSLASSLKDADDKLDTQLKAEVDRASLAESTIASNLSNHIADYETDQKSNDQDKTAIGQRITDLDTTDIAEGDKLFYTDQRVKDASVHTYAPFNPSTRTYDAPVEVKVGYGFELLKAELQAIHDKEDTDDTRHTDDVNALTTVLNSLNSEISTARSEEKKVQDDVNAKDTAMSSRVEVFEEGLNNGMEPTGEYYQENLSVQDAIDDLRGGIDYVNGQRESDKATADGRHTANQTRHTGHDDRHNGHDTAITGLANTKFDKVGGTVTGGTGFTADVGMFSNVALNVQHANQDETTNGTGKYLYFSDKWRMYGKSDGSRLVFEYNGGSQESPNWKSAIPFISSV